MGAFAPAVGMPPKKNTVKTVQQMNALGAAGQVKAGGGAQLGGGPKAPPPQQSIYGTMGGPVGASMVGTVKPPTQMTAMPQQTSTPTVQQYQASPLVNQSSPDPNLTKFQQMIEDRYGALQANERQDNAVNVKRLTDQSTSGIMDAAAGARAAQEENLVRRGVGGGEFAASEGNKIDANAQRNAALASSRIQTDQENAHQARQLARQGMTNSMLSGAQGAYAAQGQHGLQQQQLGLQQWNAQNSLGLNQQQLALQQQQAQNQQHQQQLQMWLAMANSMGGR